MTTEENTLRIDRPSQVVDLLYIGDVPYWKADQLAEAVKKNIPTAKVEVDSDDIHGYRVCVDIPETVPRSYIRTLALDLKVDLRLSFYFQELIIHKEAGVLELVKEIFAEIKQKGK